MCGRGRLPNDYSEIQLDLLKNVWRDTPARPDSFDGALSDSQSGENAGIVRVVRSPSACATVYASLVAELDGS